MFSTLFNALKVWRYAVILFVWLCRHVIASRFKKIKSGTLTLIEYADDGSLRYERKFGTGRDNVNLYVSNRMAYWHWISRGDIGLGGSYARGEWTTDNLFKVLRLMALNLDVLRSKSSLIGNTRSLIAHTDRVRNGIKESKHNISVHYDLSNDFFASFLDDEMQYSCGLFKSDSDTMTDASLNKMDYIATSLNITSDDHVLDIGCGWGHLAIYIAERYRAHIVAITTSLAQYNYCMDRLERLNATSNVDLLSLVEYRLMDYRELCEEYGQESFDKIISIEMIEHVGEANLDEFADTLGDLLSKDGAIFLQGILMPDDRYADYCENTDFIKEYIFPGGHLLSNSVLSNALDQTMLDIVVCNDITSIYTKMCAMWADQYENSEDPFSIGGRYFYNIWMFYLIYCSAGFDTSLIQCRQYILKHQKYN